MLQISANIHFFKENEDWVPKIVWITQVPDIECYVLFKVVGQYVKSVDIKRAKKKDGYICCKINSNQKKIVISVTSSINKVLNRSFQIR